MRRTAPLILGGGPAGAAAAILLAEAGRRPLLIERQAETGDALCGGFLSWTTMARLESLGVDARALGAHRVAQLRLFSGTHTAAAPLPAPAGALSRRALDSAMLARAASLGAGVERGVAVRAVEARRVRLADGTMLHDAPLVLATGKHDLRGAARPRRADEATIGLRWRLAPAPRLDALLADAIELHLFRGGYAGLVRQEDGSANLCLAVRAGRFAEAERRPAQLVAELALELPALAERLAAAPSIGPAQAIANIPYGWRAVTGTEGMYRIGDQAGVIPSLAGEGIAIAIASGALAANALLRDMPGPAFQRALARRLWRPVTLATLLWRTAERPRAADRLCAAVRYLPGLSGMAARLTRV